MPASTTARNWFWAAMIRRSAAAGMSGPHCSPMPRNDMAIAREEIFGPVLTVIKYTDERDAIRIANDSDYGLAGSVWTKDVAHGLEISGQIRTGTYGINMYMLDISSPFGGFKQSGIGREFAEEGLAEYTELQSVVSAGKLPALDGD